jgi:hypothetical protein
MRFLVPVLAIAFLAPVVARADGDAVTAEALFREGRRAADAGNYAVACPRFAESYRLDPEPGTLLNLGDCEENRGQLTRAWQHFRRLYDELPQADERRPIADARARALELRLPKLRIMLLTLSARVIRDDAMLGGASLGVSLPVDPGHHVVVVTSPGRRDKRYQVALIEGDDKVILVSAGEPLPTPEGPRALVVESPPLVVHAEHRAPSNKGLHRDATFVSAGLGIACVVTGSVFGVVAFTGLASANAQCNGVVCSSPGAVSQYREAQSFALATDVTIGVGIALIATAVVLAITAPSNHRAVGRTGARWMEGRF